MEEEEFKHMSRELFSLGDCGYRVHTIEPGDKLGDLIGYYSSARRARRVAKSHTGALGAAVVSPDGEIEWYRNGK